MWFVSPGCAIQFLFSCVHSSLSEHVNLVTTCLTAEFHMSKPWGLCMYAKAIWQDCLGVWSFFMIICLFLVKYLGEWNQWMLGCVLQEAEDTNSRAHTISLCKLNISPFITLSNLLHRQLSLCCYWKWWGDRKGAGGWFMLKLGKEERGWV